MNKLHNCVSVFCVFRTTDCCPLYASWSGNSKKREQLNFEYTCTWTHHDHSNEISGQIKCRQFVMKLSECYILKTECSACTCLGKLHWLLTKQKSVLNKFFILYTYTDNCTIIRYNDKQCVVKLLHFSVFIDHLHEGIQQKKVHYWLVITQMCNNALKIHNIKMVSKF
jgi:hypothetical protein